MSRTEVGREVPPRLICRMPNPTLQATAGLCWLGVSCWNLDILPNIAITVETPFFIAELFTYIFDVLLW